MTPWRLTYRSRAARITSDRFSPLDAATARATDYSLAPCGGCPRFVPAAELCPGGGGRG